MGAGYVYMDQAMHDQFTWRMLAILAAAKILTTSLSFVSGAPGGMFAPTLFIGAMIGGAVGGVEHHFFPWLTGSVGAYALVGMGTLFAGFLRVPLTSVFMVLEVSGNYSIILPVMISNTIAYLISRQYERVPIFDLLSRQDGLELPSMEERREGATLRVEDAMREYQGPVLQAWEPVTEALRRAQDSVEPLILLADGSGNWRGLAKQELQTLVDAEEGGEMASSLLPDEPLPCLHPDQPLDEVLRVIGNLSLLPVVSRADITKLVGVVSLADVLAAYQGARKPRAEEGNS
jgi:CIC family chloride channel protein